MKRGLALVLLFVLAAAYMRLGLFLPIHWQDEGVLVYPIWRVAEGEIPYRDFKHIYGPSVFFLNGLLMRLFGNDLAVVRYVVLVMKAVTCVMVYIGARRISGRAFAGIAYMIAVVMAGLVWPPSVIPYASFFGTVFCLAGLLGFLAAERRFLVGCLVAGLCFGLASTFKQTMGAFAFLGLALYLLLEEEEGWRGRWTAPPAFLIRMSRWFVLVFTVGLAVFYLVPRSPFWNLWLLLMPILVLVGHLALHELRGGGSTESRQRSFWGMVALSLAFLAPLAGYAIFYVSLGLGSEILFNTLLGIPSAVDWLVPFPAPTKTFVVWQLACLGSFVSVAIWRRRSGSALGDWRSGALVALLGASLLALGVLAVRGWEARYEQWWFFGPSNLLFSMPFVLVGFALAGMIRFKEAKVSVDSSGERRALFVFTCYATMSLLWLFPAADIWHILALLPSCLPLLAWLLDRFWRLPSARGRPQRAWRPLAAVLVGGLSLVLLLPAVHDLVLERRVAPAFVPSLPHATGVRGGSAGITTSGGQLVRYLVEEERRDDPLFILSGKQLFYFLTQQVSPVQEFEYILYMAAIGALREDHAQVLIDEAALVRRLREVRPRIVDDSYDVASQNIQRMYPRLARFIRTHYRLEAKFGKFRVLRWDSKSARP